jgi:hypothetical protein
MKYVQRAGKPASPDTPLTETVLRTRVLERLLHLQPLTEAAETASTMRERERDNIVRALNYWTSLVFEPSPGSVELAPKELERRRRMSYQASLTLISTLIKEIFRHILVLGATARPLMDRAITDQEWQRIQAAIQRIIEHPIWEADLNGSPRLRAVEDALAKNQGVDPAFDAVFLRLDVAMGMKQIPSDWAGTDRA